MPIQSLPNNPSLENLKKQAKTLLKSVQANESEAVARIEEFHPRAFEKLSEFALRDAQFVIARNYGFTSWTKLKKHLEVVNELSWSVPEELPIEDVDRFISLACLAYGGDYVTRHQEARELFSENPSLSQENIYAAATVGDVATVERLLKNDPALASKRGGPRDWEPILYAAYSRLNSNDPKHSTLEVGRLLLKHGADPNAGFLWEGNYVFTSLTGVFGEGESGPINQPEHQYCDQFARLLLEAGADPNDSQTLYNRMFTGRTSHLEVLFEFGLGRGGDGVWFKRLGTLGTPAEMLQQLMGWAAKYNQMSCLKLLIEHHVDVNSPDSRMKRTPYELALLNGNTEIAQYLLDHGARQTSLSDLDAFFAACLAGDSLRARNLLARDESLIQRLGSQRTELLQLAAERGQLEAVKLMSELGFNLNKVKRTTALHHAAMVGNLEMAKLLVELGADPQIKDQEFNATPLGWAEYGGKTEVAEFLRQFETERIDN